MSGQAATLFQNMPNKDLLGFGLYEGDLDYKKITNFLSFDTNDLSKMAEVSKNSVRHDSKAPQALKERFQEIAVTCSLVAEFFEGDAEKTVMWFTTPNPMLGDITPRDMLRLGRAKKLIRFIMDAKSQNGEEKQK